MVKLVFVFDHFGPYHVARVGAAAGLPGCVVTGVELHPRSRTYGWEPREGELGFRKVSLPRVELRGRAERRALRPHLERVLGECGPDVVFVNGWGDFLSLETMAWAKRSGVRVVVMSETRRVDGARSWWGEWVKGRIVGLCDAGLCGGESHRRYLGELGLPGERVALGYNAVDNGFFGEMRNAKWGMENGDFLTTEDTESTEEEAGLRLARQAGASESDSLTSELVDSPVSESLTRSASIPASLLATSYSPLATAPEAPYFLASNRFVERKNLSRLIEAYELYAKRATGTVWPLVLLGDGKLRGELEEKAEKLKLRKAEMGNFLTTEDTERTEEEAGQRPGSQAGASEPDSLQSKLADSPVSESRTRSASLPASSPATSHALPATAAGGGLVVFAGFRQVEEIREFYAGAGAFIHPALAEPWGLVINEAMASGLPVLSSRNVGAAEELVHQGVNGLLFDPMSVEELAGLMGRVAGMPVSERLAMGVASRGIVANWGPGRFAEGVREAVGMAMGGACRRAGFLDRMLLEVLIRK